MGAFAAALPFLKAMIAAQPEAAPDPGQTPMTPDQQAIAQAPQPDVNEQNLASVLNAPQAQPALPHETKGHKLLQILMGGIEGAGAGAGQRTFGAGFQQGMQLPFVRAQMQQGMERGGLENQLLRNQVQYAPLLQALGILKTQGDIQKTGAETNKFNAEAGAIPTKTALEQAQTEAANYKNDPNLGLIDLRTKQPVSQNGFAPLTADEAAILGKQPGDNVPLKLKNTANEMVNRGIRTVQANGRSLLVDNKGNTIKDMGAATPAFVLNQQMGAAANPNSPEFQSVVDEVGRNKIDLPTALGRLGRFPGAAFNLMAEVEKKYPDYFQGNYEAAKKLLDSAVAGKIGDEITAFRTAIDHAKMLKEAAVALKNGQVQLFNKWAQKWATATGNPIPTNYQTIADAFRGESTAVYNKGHITEGLIKEQGEKLGNGQSPDQLIQGLDTSIELMEKKMGERKSQFDAGMQGKPNFPENSGISVTDPRGVVHTFKDQKSADAFKAAAGIK